MASTVTNGQEPPSKKKKKKKKKTEPTTNPSLPDDLVVSCLSRVSRLHYPSLSFVSKSFRSLLASPELYQTRSLLNRTESCLYVCLQYPPDPNPRWFTLCLKPNPTLSCKKKKKNESSGYVLAPISILNSPPAKWSDLVSVDHNLYAICKPMEAAPCSKVSFLDCRTHTWLEAQSLRLAHTGTLYDGSMYLPGSCENAESLNCVEVFNTKTQTWEPVPIEKRILNLRNLEGKIHLVSDAMPGMKGVTVKPKEMTIEPMEFGQGSLCMLQTIIYYCSNGEFQWSDNRVRRKVEGLEGLPKLAGYSSVKLADCGGKMVVLWDKYLASSWFKEKVIWCAVISLEKRGSEEIWGKVEWCDVVLTVPSSYKFVYATAATV